jgi:diacylglycerol kinase family enzyme
MENINMKIRWRLTAFVALFLYVVIVFSILLVAVRNPWFAIFLGIDSAILLWAAWLFLTAAHTARRRQGQVLFGIGCLGALVLLIRFWNQIRQTRAFIGLLLVALSYLALVGLLRRAYWKNRREKGGLLQPTGDFKNPFLIINPKSGDGRATKAHIGALAQRNGITTLVMGKGDDVESLARLAVAKGADVLGISGGDGSIGAVVKVALEYDLPVVVLPGGTRCHFARDLGLDPRRIVDSLSGFKGVERRIDVGQIGDRTFLNNVSFGLYAAIVDQPDYRDNKLSVSRREIAALVNGGQKPYSLQFLHGDELYSEAAQIVVAVNQYQTFNLLELGRRDRLDGGILQVTAITKLNDAIVRRLARTMVLDRGRGQHVPAYFYQWTAPSFDLSSQYGSLVVGVDGEREEFDVPITVKVLAGALRVFVPAEGVRGRPQSAFGPAMLKNMWRAGVHADT